MAYHIWRPPLNVAIFITHVRNGGYANEKKKFKINLKDVHV